VQGGGNLKVSGRGGVSYVICEGGGGKGTAGGCLEFVRKVESLQRSRVGLFWKRGC